MHKTNDRPARRGVFRRAGEELAAGVTVVIGASGVPRMTMRKRPYLQSYQGFRGGVGLRPVTKRRDEACDKLPSLLFTAGCVSTLPPPATTYSFDRRCLSVSSELRSLPEGQSLRDVMLQTWQEEGRLGEPGSVREKEREELLFGSGGVYDSEQLHVREAMLQQLESSFS